MSLPRNGIVLLTLLMIGCSGSRFASTTSQAVRVDRSASDGRAVQIGREQSLFGQRLVSSGRQKVNTGGERIRTGERLIAAGSEQVIQNRQAYERLAQRLQPDDPQLESIRESWDAGVELIREGNAMISDGGRQIETGQLEIREGRALMQSAATVIRSAERTYQEPLVR